MHVAYLEDAAKQYFSTRDDVFLLYFDFDKLSDLGGHNFVQ